MNEHLDVTFAHFSADWVKDWDSRRAPDGGCAINDGNLEPWPRQLDRKLDSYLTGYSTVTRQLLDRIARQLLDSSRQTSTEPPLTACDGASRCQARQLDSSTDLDRPRQTSDTTTDLDRAEPIRISLFECLAAIFSVPQNRAAGMGEPFMRGIVRSVCSFVLFLT